MKKCSTKLVPHWDRGFADNESISIFGTRSCIAVVRFFSDIRYQVTHAETISRGTESNFAWGQIFRSCVFSSETFRCWGSY